MTDNNNNNDKEWTVVSPRRRWIALACISLGSLLLLGILVSRPTTGTIPESLLSQILSYLANDHAAFSRSRRRQESPFLPPSLALIQSMVRKLASDDDDNDNHDHSTVLQVHIVPHTHDDVGWRKTVEQYFYGWNDTMDPRGHVRDILSTAVEALLEHEARTFTYVEQKFFTLWWDEQNDSVRDSLRSLIANDQWFFVNGGWCMHDEASTHYIGMMDQTTLGHAFLHEQLGVIPTVGWQLDPFGHSATQASLLTARAGMDALYFGRIDYQDLAVRQVTQECEGLWKATSTSSNDDDSDDDTIFWGLTGSYEGNYGPPPGFCFDVQCRDEKLLGLNQTRLMQRLHTFLEYVRVQADRTRGNHIMLTMGTDFNVRQKTTRAQL